MGCHGFLLIQDKEAFINKVQHSEDIKAGLHQGFQNGTSRLAQRKCYGYDVISSEENRKFDQKRELFMKPTV